MKARVHILLGIASSGDVEDKQRLWILAVLTNHIIFNSLNGYLLKVLTARFETDRVGTAVHRVLMLSVIKFPKNRKSNSLRVIEYEFLTC